MDMQVNIDRIKRRIDKLSSFNATPGNGCTRFSFSEEYEKALDFIKQECAEMGLPASIDGIGNLRCRLEGSLPDSPSILTGSHLDTVPFGGNYDGVVGVVGALEVLNVINEQKISIKNSVELIVFVEEEGSSFGSTMVGSKTLVGRYKTEDLKCLLNESGTSFYEAAKNFGLNPEGIEPGCFEKGQFKAMLELHIEQSLVLESRSVPVGIVKAIAGIKQFKVILKGVPNHAGATPMDLRNDPLCGAAKLITFLELSAKYDAFDSTVATVGKIQCYPNVPNVIPGEVVFTVDIRDVRAEGIERVEALFREEIQKISSDYGLEWEFSMIGETETIELAENLIDLLERNAKQLKMSYFKMNSGAVHDSSLLAELTDVGMIFVPSVKGRSHVPEEYTEIQDIKLGCDLLLASIIELAN